MIIDKIGVDKEEKKNLNYLTVVDSIWNTNKKGKKISEKKFALCM